MSIPNQQEKEMVYFYQNINFEILSNRLIKHLINTGFTNSNKWTVPGFYWYCAQIQLKKH